MPVIIAPEDQTRWLEGTHDDAQALLKPSPAELLMCHPVSTRVNSPRNNEAACIQPA
jgi:putative SOS response-associated peptidase YedK